MKLQSETVAIIITYLKPEIQRTVSYLFPKKQYAIHVPTVAYTKWPW